MADAVVTVTEDTAGAIRKITWDWLSASDGSASKATTNRYTGKILRVVFDPDASTTQPSDQYDVTITDGDGADVLNGTGANLSQSANVTKVEADKLCVVSSTLLTLNVTNAGDAKGGVVYLYIQPMYT